MKRFVRAYPALTWTLLAVLVAGAVFVLVWFQPQKLFIEETVDEAPPALTADEEETPAPGQVRLEPSDRT